MWCPIKSQGHLNSYAHITKEGKNDGYNRKDGAVLLQVCSGTEWSDNRKSNFNLLDFSRFQKKCVRLRVTTGEPRAGNIPEMCMSEHALQIWKGKLVTLD